jgi:O-antigen/teichoic acid export membrane protein
LSSATTGESLPLKQNAVSALKWNYLGQGVRSGSGFVIGIVLARLLGPTPFGEVAIAGLVIGLGCLMADFGFGAALIQPKEVTDEEIRFAFSVQVLLGLVLSVAGFCASGLIARAFRQPHVTPVLQVLMLTFVLQSIGLTSSSLLRRQLAFKTMQTAQVISYISGYLAVGIPLAYLGYGVWALVAAQMVQTALNAALLYNASRHSVTPLLSLRYRRLIMFGGTVIGTNLANWTIYNLDTAIAGRCFGVFDLGLYNRAFVFATTPVNGAIIGLQQVLFPGTARAQDEHEKLKRTYLGSLAILALVTVPAYAAVAMAPRTILVALYGQQWAPAAPLLAAFAVAMPFYALMGVVGPLLWGMGKVGYELRVQLVVGIAAVASFPLASRVSLLALAWAVAAIYLLRLILMTRALVRTLQISWTRVLQAIYRPAVLGLIAAVVVWGVDSSLARGGGGAIMRLIADMTAGMLAVLAALIFDPSAVFGPDGGWLLNSVRSGIPQLFSRFLPPPESASHGAM